MSTADQILFYQWVQKRDAQAFKSLTSKYCGMVHGTCVRILRNATDAEDVTQECFTALAAMTSGPQGSMGAWLHRVATHQALNHRRSDQRRRLREERYAKSKPVTTEASWDDVSRFVDEAIERLPDKLRVAIVSHFMEDESVTAIAAQEGVTHGAISQRLQKGVLLIRESLKQRGVTVGVAALATMFTQNAFAISIQGTALPQTLGKIALSGKVTAPHGFTVSSLGGAKGLAALAAMMAIIAGVFVFVTRSESQSVGIARVEAQVQLVPEAVSQVNSAPIVVSAPEAEPPGILLAADSPKPAIVPVAVEETPPVAKKIDGWRDVLRAYVDHQDRIRSITVEYEHSMKGDYFHSSYSPEPGYREAFQWGTLITDGARCYMEQHRWGNWFGDEIIPEEQADFHACAWNGAEVIEYHGGGGSWYGVPGSLQLHLDAMNSMIRDSAFNYGRNYLLYGRYPGKAMLGYPVPTGRRIDDFLYGTRDIALRSKKESAGGADCYVVDAETDYGTFAIWFDPTHDYNIVKYTFGKRPGHLVRDFVLKEGMTHDYTYDVQEFAKVDGLWVPKESISRDTVRGLGGEGYDYTHHHKRTSITLNVESDDDNTYALHAEYIPNGARWMNFDNPKDQTEYIWYNGKVVAKTDKHKIPTSPTIKRAGGLIARGFGAARSK